MMRIYTLQRRVAFLFLLTCALSFAGCQTGSQNILATDTVTIAIATVGQKQTPSLPTAPRPTRAVNPTAPPTSTPKVVRVTPEVEIVCDRPETLPDTEVDVSGLPFCIVWVDPFDDETGYQVHLDYFHSGERFVYEVGPDTVQLVVPAADAPRLEESFEQCRNRQELIVAVVALRDSIRWPVNSMTLQSECEEGS